MISENEKKQLSFGLEAKTKQALENNESHPQDHKIRQWKEPVSLGVNQRGPEKDKVISQKKP